LRRSRAKIVGIAVDGSIWIIVPAYNESERIGATLQRLCDSYANIVVVDDGSRDDTSEMAHSFPVWLLRHIVNCGQGAALQTGIDFALEHGADILVTFDADGQHAVEDIRALCEPVRSGRFDVALGSRFLGKAEGIPWIRWLTLKIAIVFTRLYSRMSVTDTHNGLRCMSRSAARRIRLTQNRMAHASELLDEVRRLGLRYCEVPVTLRYSSSTLQKGQTSWNSLRIVGQLLLGRITR
jgi:glycosyltransferase involved in cell wall biosynthesis